MQLPGPWGPSRVRESACPKCPLTPGERRRRRMAEGFRRLLKAGRLSFVELEAFPKNQA